MDASRVLLVLFIYLRFLSICVRADKIKHRSGLCVRLSDVVSLSLYPSLSLSLFLCPVLLQASVFAEAFPSPPGSPGDPGDPEAVPTLTRLLGGRTSQDQG